MLIEYIKQFLGIWYGVQSDDEIPACETYDIKVGEEPFQYTVATDSRLSTAKQKYKTSLTEYLNAFDIDLPSKMSVSPLPRKTFVLSFSLFIHLRNIIYFLHKFP